MCEFNERKGGKEMAQAESEHARKCQLASKKQDDNFWKTSTYWSRPAGDAASNGAAAATALGASNGCWLSAVSDGAAPGNGRDKNGGVGVLCSRSV
jgi:hypothetical protein